MLPSPTAEPIVARVRRDQCSRLLTSEPAFT
jgi:hypothetical protein